MPHKTFQSPEEIEAVVSDLINKPLSRPEEKKEWLLEKNRFMQDISEDAGWRYIHMTCDTASEEKKENYLRFVRELEPKLTEADFELQKKYVSATNPEDCGLEGSQIFVPLMKKAVSLFRKENIPLKTKLQELAQQYSEISGAQSAEWEGQTVPLQKLSVHLKSPNREIRKKAWEAIQSRKLKDEDALNRLLDEMIALRHQMALNAGFKNYRDFRHEELGRMDYSVQDCFRFHNAVEEVVVPLMRKAEGEKIRKMNLSGDYRPWDVQADEDASEPAKPFENGKELYEKSLECLRRTDPYFAECIKKMHEAGRLDLESRLGKAPGGYQYPLYASRIPFIFMNAAGTVRDMVTMLHESGHAVHSFLSGHWPLMEQISVPSEMAELASMSMELITMDHWEVFFQDEKELRRAKKDHLRDILSTLPWIATIDAFQHFLYENPKHSREERYAFWASLFERFGNTHVNYSGLEHYFNIRWQSQLHIYEVPFYYIEYGIAQLGAIAIWKNHKENPKQALEKYKQALSLGYTRPLPELYKAAGIAFDFSASYIRDLSEFLYEEYEKCSQ
ncbi:MAG: M3 family oligoendopeptidase [Bacteroidia bacterium]|nr:M3 family oligoendopeptidase [Bacteroidia bacterium]